MQRTGREAGFTIIEVLFFLAISGALVVALLATVGFTISRQRFTDSVIGTQSWFQSQYNLVLNVVNDRGDNGCTETDGITQPGGGPASSQGASDCVVLGRAIDITDGGSRLTAYPVLGTEPATDDGATGAALLAEYHPGVDTGSAQNYDIPWGATVKGVNPAGTSRILLLRSPESGLVLTFGGGGGASLAGALTAGTHTYNVCLQSADITNAVSMVSLSPVAGSEGVTTKSDLTGTEQGNLC